MGYLISAQKLIESPIQYGDTVVELAKAHPTAIGFDRSIIPHGSHYLVTVVFSMPDAKPDVQRSVDARRPQRRG